eukprot:TRINITY_DN7728_c0_g1::TRINITY_DN7728_c0_g1_i1::g.8341::m.8341 TRINITY_DN7728_c0_g1::TRINITY_DN7728_c0_g1_i1::g.8341  ORF type:complete len:316 (-),score=57.12,sp/Q5E9I7/MEP50_BOVIN/29.49/7e-23,WD40/PF00400.27/0.042,WD40/PF00400.27/0.00091,WD40/PF00400.27/5.7e-09,WD40/PF00400.27/0.03,WD40/PF00400.27/4.5e-06,WD40/PF00400.27/0.042,PQQ_3/PF13570.1/0.064,PQQ_3/PF13570.1/1.2e+02,PQQ_3/PF13570.1/3.4e+03,Coatomer_WDAD/PF04053.9/61,Coatomer_WDAD/PF04053.9/0.79,HemX/PF04375.9/0.17,RCC1_2/PF13540.1/0.49,RC
MAGLQTQNHVDALCFGPKDSLVIGTSSLTGQNWGGEVVIAQLSGDKLTVNHSYPTESGIADVCWSGDRVVVASDDGNVYAWGLNNADTQAFTLREHDAPVIAISANPLDTAVIGSGSWDLSVKIWNTKEEQSRRTFTGHTQRITAVDWADSTMLSSSEDNTVRQWDERLSEVENGIAQVISCDGVPMSLDVHPTDKNHVAVGCMDGLVRIFDLRAALEPVSVIMTTHKEGVRRVKYSPDGNHVASASDDTTVVLSSSRPNTSEPRVVMKFTDFVRGLSWGSKSQLAAGSWDKTVQVVSNVF